MKIGLGIGLDFKPRVITEPSAPVEGAWVDSDEWVDGEEWPE